MGKYIEEMKLNIDDNGHTMHGIVKKPDGDKTIDFEIETKFITHDSRLGILTEPVDVHKLVDMGVTGKDAYDTITGAIVEDSVIDMMVKLLEKLAGEEACSVSEIAISEALSKKYGEEYGAAYLYLWFTNKGYVRDVYLMEFKKSMNTMKEDENGSDSTESSGNS